MNHSSVEPRYLVYTAVTASSPEELRDNLLPISDQAEDPLCDFVCFTNLAGWTAPRGWTTKHVSMAKVKDIASCVSQRPRLLARSVKLLIHEYLDLSPYSVAMWVDGNVNFLRRPSLMIEAFRPSTTTKPFMMSFLHHERNRVTKEITFIRRHRPEELTNLPYLEGVFRREGFADESSLYETCVVMRDVCGATKDFCKQWWGLMAKVGLRDQVILPYIVFKNLDSVSFVGAPYKWRSEPTADVHLDWPKAPWVERRPHNRLK